MLPRTRNGSTFKRVVRWIARSWSIASIALVLISMVLERTHPGTPAEWVGFVFFPVGVSVGMVLAWRWEGLGGSVAVGCLLVFYVIHLITAGMFPRGLGWLLFAAPGFLFLLCWRVSRVPAQQRPN